MSTLKELLDNNARFAETDAKAKVPDIPFIPNKQVYVLTCIDPRVDPAATMGLELGDAIVARTVGGRANQSFLDDLAWISYLHETKTPDAEWFEIAVVHHTDCGSALMADPQLRKGFAELGFDDEELRRTAVVDPADTVPVDVQAILDAPTVSGRIRVSGYRYDVKTGRIEQLVAPRSRDGR
ncbi:carbonic anhydrase [Amycolatopsis sp. Hca4]|uniref:carbonic anhydrase n=1 Tax=unclassified Amycolatopsis TaxID=2618356 RepID=UPI0015905255|nr:carbonic anhydrase [Amycolatopsis sp. Hca4]QKV80584.1 carbonic anhydrase [Amycolatopsis sp. Hca4]